MRETVNLIIDIGNTSAKIAVFEGSQLLESIKCCNYDLADVNLLFTKYKPMKGALSSVVQINDKVEEQLQALPFELLRVNAQTPLPLKVSYQSPDTLGADRIAVAVEAASQHPGKDILIVDSGTCITYELVTAQGEYMGGNISPGLEMRLQALHDHTAKLPLVNAEGETPAIGFNTETAIRSGVIKGIEYEIEGYIRSLRAEKPSLLVFLTGGNYLNFDTNVKSGIFADKYLLLKGLNRILNYNDY